MTEKEIITLRVKEKWDRLTMYIDLFGEEDWLTEHARSEWSALNDLYRELYPNETY